jgi:hypothetical protein
MPYFGETSTARLATCDRRLQEIAHEAIKHVDFSITEGHRSNERQEELFADNKTQARAGESPHNHVDREGNPCSSAFDFIPWPFTGWDDHARFAHIAGIFRGIAMKKGYGIRWGGDWDMDGVLVQRDPDEHFNDMPHIELTEGN